MLKKMNNVWELYKRNEIEEPKLKENKNVTSVNLCKHKKYLGIKNIGAEGCSHLSKAHWAHLQQIDLCKIISIIRLEQYRRLRMLAPEQSTLAKLAIH